MNPTPPRPDRASEFASRADERGGGTLRELLSYMGSTKKWWLTPVILALMLVGALVLLSSTAAAPFIYTLF